MDRPQYIPNFLTARELANTYIPRRWHRSTVIDDSGALIVDSMRTSSQAALRNSKLIALLQMRMRAFLSRPTITFDEGSFVRYEEGNSYALHGDVAGLASGRDWTLLLSLEAAKEGGETDFPHAGERFRVQPGDALIWPNRRQHTPGVWSENDLLDHRALPVRAGRKTVINAWFSSTQNN